MRISPERLTRSDLADVEREELVSLALEMARALTLTYRDRMILEVMRRAPFTIWACDSEFRIRLWEGMCESRYGYEREDVLGQRYLELFVAEDERKQSEEDCLRTITRGEKFYNCVAEDKGALGPYRVITNCFRVRDVDSGEYLQAEIGVDISNFDEEEQKYSDLISSAMRVRERKKEAREEMNSSLREIRALVDALDLRRVVVEEAVDSALISPAVSTSIADVVSRAHAELDTFSNGYDEGLGRLETATSIDAIDLIANQLRLLCTGVMFRLSRWWHELDQVLSSPPCRALIDEIEQKRGLQVTVERRFAVGLTFSGEDRVLARSIARGLARQVGRDRVLFDEYITAQLARPNADTHLQRLYLEECELVVVVLSQSYNEKAWTGVEWRAVRELMNTGDGERIMFLRSADGTVDGVFGSVDVYVTAWNRQPSELVQLIIERLSEVRAQHNGKGA